MNDYTVKTNLADSTSTFDFNSSTFSPIVVRAPLAGSDSYYRSSTFTTHAGINPLISAASALLVINARLKHCSDYQNIANLYQHLVHEVRAFETKAQNLGFRTETILVARYALCAVLDETIMNSPWGKQQWQQQLLNTFQREDNVGEKFFIILDRISEDASFHIDLLELIYVCLSLGYEGKYRDNQNNKADLDSIIDMLYQKIRKQRQELKPLLQSKVTVAAAPSAIKTKTYSLTKYSIVACATLAAAFLGIDILLTQSTLSLNTELQTIAQLLTKFHGIS